MKLFFLLKKLYLVVALAFWPCALTVPLWMHGAWYELAVLLYYALMCPLILLPCYLAYVEFGACVGRLFDGKERARGERMLGWITPAVAVALVAVTFMFATTDTSTIPRSVLYVLYILLFNALLILWIVGVVKYKKRLRLKALLQPKSVWVTALVLVCLCLACGLFYRYILEFGSWQDIFGHSGGKPDPLA